MALPIGILVALYLTEFAPTDGAQRRQPRARRAERRPGDRDRHLRLRALRARPRTERARGLVRARLPHAAARRALDDRGARYSSRARCGRRASRSASRAGGRRSASCSRRRSAASSPARCSRSPASRARRRRFSSRRRSSARSVHWNPHHALQTVPVAIFELSESPDPAGSRARLGGRARAAALHPLHQPRRARWLATRSRERLSTSR